MAPRFEKAFKMRGYFDKENTVNTGAIRSGPHRIITPIRKGIIEGPGVKAEILPGSGEWALAIIQLDPVKHIAHLDVRLQARTTKGESLHIHCKGLVHVDGKASRILQYESGAKTTEFGDHYWFTAPTFETSDETLKWTEDSFFVSEGRFIVDEIGYGIEYEIYRITN